MACLGSKRAARWARRRYAGSGARSIALCSACGVKGRSTCLDMLALTWILSSASRWSRAAHHHERERPAAASAVIWAAVCSSLIGGRRRGRCEECRRARVVFADAAFVDHVERFLLLTTSSGSLSGHSGGASSSRMSRHGRRSRLRLCPSTVVSVSRPCTSWMVAFRPCGTRSNVAAARCDLLTIAVV